MKREVIDFHHAVASLVEPLGRLARGAVPSVAETTREYFRDVYDHAVRISTRVDSYRDLLTSILEANLTQVSVRQNEDMRKISSWVAVGVAPALVAGIYGMNFNRMPGLDSAWGFPIVLALMATVATTLYLLFRRSGWL